MKIKKTKYDIIIGILGLLALIGTSIFLIVTWKNIPAQVPGHYNAAGVADSMTGKGSIIFEFVFGWVLYLMLWGLEQVPQIWNTGVKVTPSNQWRVYRILKNMLVTLRFLLAVIFCYLAVVMSFCKNLPVSFMVLILVMVFGDIGFSCVLLIRAGRS